MTLEVEERPYVLGEDEIRQCPRGPVTSRRELGLCRCFVTIESFKSDFEDNCHTGFRFSKDAYIF